MFPGNTLAAQNFTSMTLIAVYNSDGCVGRCDAKCYEATHPHCNCVCGGKNHGAGLDTATANTREMADTWVKNYIEAKRLDGASGSANPEIYQLKLF